MTAKYDAYYSSEVEDFVGNFLGIGQKTFSEIQKKPLFLYKGN